MWRPRSYIGLGLTGMYIVWVILVIKRELECGGWLIFNFCGFGYRFLAIPWIFLFPSMMTFSSDDIPYFLFPFYILNVLLLYGIGALISS
jgi:hypothetical protein